MIRMRQQNQRCQLPNSIPIVFHSNMNPHCSVSWYDHTKNNGQTTERRRKPSHISPLKRASNERNVIFEDERVNSQQEN